MQGGKSKPCRGYKAVQSYKDVKGRERTKEREGKEGLHFFLPAIFTTSQSALSDGWTQIYTDYHTIVKHEVKSVCVWVVKTGQEK